MKTNTDGPPELGFVLKAWLFFVFAIAILDNSKLVSAKNQHAGRKLAAEIPGFISIDCGNDEGYTDKKTGIPYKSDKQMIDTGIVGTISLDSSVDTQLLIKKLGTADTQLLKKLRSFPQGTRNCYTLRPEQGKNTNYLVRATFFYGNYDGKNITPAFDLYLGPNLWDTVNSSVNISYAIIHAPTTDNIDVCLVNTGHGVPFISALELRHLDNSIYPPNGGALSITWRYDIGLQTTESVYRYPIDPYDRLWTPRLDGNWIRIATDSIIYTQGNDNPYEIPGMVLTTAAKTPNASIPLSLCLNPPDSRSKFYVYFHFAEIEKLGAGQQRELNIALNGNLIEYAKLDYLKPLTKFQNDQPISGSQLNFSIYATEGTKFPPILNAIEIFMLKELRNKPTAIDDVGAIVEIKKRYTVTKNWQGDPCVPSEYSWEGLNCSNDDNPPRIISLNLSSSKLEGEIASSFSNLKALQSLDLSYNDLTGPLPEVLDQLPYLNTLDLRGNKLTGSIPEALEGKSRDGKLVLRVGDNPDLCLSAPCKRKKKDEFLIPVVASSIAVLLVFLFIFSALAMHRRKKRAIVSKSNIKSKNRRYSYSEVLSITNNLNTIIGRGGFGSVYLGTLKDDSQVAVKLLSPSSNQGYKEFQAEAQLLMVIHHRNLVSLVGYCDEGENKALIYEYMANGNLQQQLSGDMYHNLIGDDVAFDSFRQQIRGKMGAKTYLLFLHTSETFNKFLYHRKLIANEFANTRVLKWNERIHIAVDAAQGLEYLQNGCERSMIHRDVKTSNILLNEHMQAKIADFGLSRAFATESDSHVSTRPVGTIGYLDPEFQISGIFNKKSDVYSFGIVLFELITGQPAIIRGPERSNHILDLINPLIERGDIQNIVDPRLEGKFSTNSAWKAMDIAMSCVSPIAIQRPDMSNVLAELKECLADLERSQSIATEGATSTTYSGTESEISLYAR